MVSRLFPRPSKQSSPLGPAINAEAPYPFVLALGSPSHFLRFISLLGGDCLYPLLPRAVDQGEEEPGCLALVLKS